MRILIVRHGDPDYENDSLTEAGKKEAELLVPRMIRENVKDFYVSPLGRAKRTLQPTLDALGREAVTLDWLEEFPTQVDINGNAFLQKAYPDTGKNPDGSYKKRISWDMLPSMWRDEPAYYDRDLWRRLPVARNSQMEWAYERIGAGFDALVEKYGYSRDGGVYRTSQGNNDTIALFCHFGMTTVILSWLWGVSPHILPHVMCMAPTSVTELRTEEREKGIAIFRATKIGDISHLYAADTQPSFAARFCEVYENDWERH